MDYPVLDKISMFPLIKNFKSNTIFKAFLLSAIFQTILLSLTLSTRDIFKKYQTNEFLKWLFSIIYIFIITVLSYTIMYLVFDYGGGMLIN